MPSHDRVIPCLVPLDVAWKWAEETGDPAHVATMSLQFAEALGMDPLDVRDVVAVTLAVQDHLGDLLAMPPRPKGVEEIVAEAIATDTETGKVIDETEMRDDV